MVWDMLPCVYSLVYVFHLIFLYKMAPLNIVHCINLPIYSHSIQASDCVFMYIEALIDGLDFGQRTAGILN